MAAHGERDEKQPSGTGHMFVASHAGCLSEFVVRTGGFHLMLGGAHKETNTCCPQHGSASPLLRSTCLITPLPWTPPKTLMTGW